MPRHPDPGQSWGFDGKVVVDQHNVLSILVDNPSDVNVDVRLRIENEWGGLPLEEGVFLGPFQRRWVQFFPWVSNSSGAWTIQWVDEKNRRQKVEINDGGVPFLKVLVRMSNLSRKMPSRRIGPNGKFFRMNSFQPVLPVLVHSKKS